MCIQIQFSASYFFIWLKHGVDYIKVIPNNHLDSCITNILVYVGT